ncbi:MAG TPA: alginate export family protein [Bryobacteraceae bacterium]|nr:alginate export family protein [Bryobacteraceae bacterium]
MRISQTCIALVGYLGGAMLFAQDAKQPEPTPVSNEINTELPRWLRFSGEERARMEYIAGEGFKPVDDLYLLNRLRLNMDLLPLSWLKFGFQAEDSRVFGQNTLPAPASQKDAMDLRLGYVQLGSEEGPATLRAGRQGLDFGEGRLLADPNWSNVGRSFDAARLTLRHRLLKVDLFTGASVKVNPLDFDLPTPGEHVDGAYGSLGGIVPNATIEPYLFWRLEHNYKSESGRFGNLDEKTAGFRWTGKLPVGFDYTAEIAGQAGSSAGDSIGAWMGHWVVGHTLPDARHRPRIFVEYNRASGDANPKDGAHGTFDGLFPSSHDKYGLTDLLCSSNVVHFRPGFQYTLRPGLTVAAAYNNFWLASARDGLYVGGKIVARSVNGTAGTHIGQEGDVQAQWTVTRATQVSVGYGRLFPGEFLQRTTAGMPYNIVFTSIAQRF